MVDLSRLSINSGKETIGEELDSHITTVNDRIEKLSKCLKNINEELEEPLSSAQQDIDQSEIFLDSGDYYRSYLHAFRAKRDIFNTLLFLDEIYDIRENDYIHYYMRDKKSSYQLLAEDMMGRFDEKTKEVISDLLSKENLTKHEWRKLTGTVEIQRITEKEKYIEEKITDDTLTRHLAYFTLIAIGSGTMVFILSAFYPTDLTEVISNPLQWQYLWYYVAFGVLGSAVSGILSRRDRSDITPLDTNAGFWIGFAKIILGAISAIFVVVAVYAEIFNIGTATFGKLLSFSFISGFSEKLLRRAVEPYITE